MARYPSLWRGSKPFTGAERTRVAVVVLLGLTLVLLSPRAPVPMLAHADVPVATATTALVRASGLAVERQGAVLHHPGGFAMEVYWRCTGLLPAAFLAALVVASPCPLRWRLAGAIVGGGLILLLNLSRLLVLFVLGVFRPEYFARAHDLWELIIVLSVPTAWLLWLNLGRQGAGTMDP